MTCRPGSRLVPLVLRCLDLFVSPVDDDFALKDCYVTATIRCVPPGNKPLPEEIENCRPYFLEELDLLKNIKIIVPLGHIAFNQTLRALRLKGFKIPPLSFGHSKVYEVSTDEVLRTYNSQLRTVSLVVTYHPSQQNTQTGKLTKPMFHQVFEIIQNIVRS